MPNVTAKPPETEPTMKYLVAALLIGAAVLALCQYETLALLATGVALACWRS